MDTHALCTLWNTTQLHPGTSGARACAGVLLGLYNGQRFPFNLTELRLLDAPLRTAAIAVITADSTRCQYEVHDWLNRITGEHNFGMRLEHLAHEYRLKGRCKRDCLYPINDGSLVINMEDAA